MIAKRKPSRRRRPTSTWHEGFLAMLPRIRKYARVAFRNLNEEAQEDAVAETIANAMVAYVRLFERGKVDLAYPTVLVRYAVAQIHDGRRVGNHLNTKDVLAESAHKRHAYIVERLVLQRKVTAIYSI